MELEKQLELNFLLEFLIDETDGYIESLVVGKAGVSLFKYYYMAPIIYVKTKDKQNDRFFSGTSIPDFFFQIKQFYYGIRK